MSMTPNAMKVFNFMKSHPGEDMTKQDIAAQVGVSVSTVTGTTNALIKKGRAIETVTSVEEEGKTKNIKYVRLSDEGLMYDPEAEEAEAREARERAKAERARAREAKRAAKAESED